MPSRQINTWPDLSVFDPVTGELLDTQRTPPPQPQRQQAAMPSISGENVYANSPEFKAIIQKAMESPDSLSKTERQQVEKAIDLGVIPDVLQQGSERQAEEDLKPMKEALGKFGKELIETAKHPTLYQRGSLGMAAINAGRELLHLSERATGEFIGNILGIEKYTGRKLSDHLQDAFADLHAVPLGPDDPGASFEIENKFTGELETVKMTDAERATVNLFQNVATLAPTLLVTALENPVEFMTGVAKFPFEQGQLVLDAALGEHISISENGFRRRSLSDEEIDEARETLIQNPLGPIMATLMVAGAGRYVTRKARAAEAKAAKKEARKPKEAEGALREVKKEEKAPEKVKPPVAKEPSEVPLKVQRIEEGETLSSVDKPQGLYTTPEGVKSPHIDLGGKRFVLDVNPKANVLRVEAKESVSGGIATLKKLLSEKEYAQLVKEPYLLTDRYTSLYPRSQLTQILSEKYPKVDWSKYFDQQEMLEGYAGKIARDKGYDAIWAFDKVSPEFGEYIGLNKNAFLKPKAPPPLLQAEAKPIEGEVLGLKKTEIDRIREALPGVEKLKPLQKKAWDRSMAEAKEAKLDVNALETARAITESDRPTTAAEHAGMVSKAIDLAKEYNERLETHSELIEKGATDAAQIERGFITALTKDLDVLTEASERFGGTETARALSIRRMMRKIEDNSPAGVVRRGRAFKGKSLTETETGRLEASGQKYEAVRKQLEEVEGKLAESQAANEKLVAQDIATREVRQARISKKAEKQHEFIMLERAEIKAGLQKLGYRVNDVTGVTAEGAYWIGRLAVSYIKEGATTLDAVVKKVLIDVPDLTATDVYKSLANKEGRRQAKARSDVTKRIQQMKRQADLLVKVENAEKGVFEPTIKRAPIPSDIRELQRSLRDLRTEAYRSQIETAKLEKAIQTINELQDQIDYRYRPIRKRKIFEKKIVDTPEFAAAKDKIRELRKTMRVEDELVRLNEQQRTGEYEVRERPKPKEVPPELERLQVYLERARKRNRDEIERLKPITAKRIAAETVGALRTAKATADLSGTLRQGLFLITSRPGAAPKAFAQSLAATFSEFEAEAIDLAIRSHPNHYLRERAGVEFTELGGKLSGREEMISSNVMEKIPLYGEVVKGSQRHMTTFLNLMRASVFDGFLERFPNATRAELKAWGNSVNVFSGRGTIGKYGGLAQWVAFAPRFAISRVETPYLVFRHWKEPRVRKEIAKTYARTAVLGGSLLAMAKLAGFDVGFSPRDPDFGKIVVGNTRIDIWAGVQQPIRLVTRIGFALSDRVGVTGKDMADSEKQLDPVELISRFAAFKLAPAITIPRELLTGKSAVGEPRTPTETGIRSVVPLVYEDILDAYRLEGTERAAVVGGLVTLGVGVSTYEDSKAAVRRDISKLLREKKRGDAIRKALEWNREHPDQAIRKVSGFTLTKAKKKSVFAPEGR